MLPPFAVIEILARLDAFWTVVWAGLGGCTIALVVALVRYRRAETIHNCIVLSVWAHVLLAVYAGSVRVMHQNGGPGRETVVQLDIVDSSFGERPKTSEFVEPREPPPVVEPAESKQPEPTPEVEQPPTQVAPAEPPAPPEPEPMNENHAPHIAAKATSSDETKTAGVNPAARAEALVTSVSAALASQRQWLDKMVEQFNALPKAAAAASNPNYDAPKIYQARLAPDHTAQASTHGGSPETEGAVKAALVWLASGQSPDGRWDPRRHGAGQESRALGQDRHGAGARADTGITGLALLAFLGSGQTHMRGDYPSTVARGIDFLIRSQGARGELGGNAEVYAFMYCHGMATLALSEAYAMSGDPRLERAVQRAINYTVGAQNRATGGWRYRPGDPGDLSQLGWQLMALKSAELAGIPINPNTRDGIARFIASVSSGARGGLASYRPGERPSRTMTAEALVCRQFLGLATDGSTEAADFVVQELPGTSTTNLYYWYYATLGLYQLQGERWTRWNAAVVPALVKSQHRDDEWAGSWDPDPVWGAHGGRVYSTALGALCLEVYYRYLPLYIEAAGREKTAR